MAHEPDDTYTPHVTPFDMQESINDLFVRVDELHEAVYDNNNRLADMERSLALFVHLISDKLGVSSGEMND
jgi:hypothetical protein